MLYEIVYSPWLVRLRMDKVGQSLFEITRVFEISNRGVVLAGQIRSGVVRQGMQAHLPLNSGVDVVATVKSVEFVDHGSGNVEVDLILDEEDPQCRSLLLQLYEAGDVISIREAAV
jgi:GTPase